MYQAGLRMARIDFQCLGDLGELIDALALVSRWKGCEGPVMLGKFDHAVSAPGVEG